MKHRFSGFGLVVVLGCVGCEDNDPVLVAPFARTDPGPGGPGGPGVPGAPAVPGAGGSFSVGGGPGFRAGGGIGGGIGQPPLPGALITSERRLPPVSGGTLLVLADQATAIVADPDRDQVIVAALKPMSVTATLALQAGAEPGRAVEDASGNVHVVLRGTGQLLTLDPQSGAELGLRNVCRYPRGVTVQNELVHVACAEGRLVSLSPDPKLTAPVRDLVLDRDLRDVVPAKTGLWLSRFRSAEVLRIDDAGLEVARYRLLDVAGKVASVAWRMIAGTDGGVIVTHQRASVEEIAPSPGGYSGLGAGGIVDAAISEVSDAGVVKTNDSVIPNPLPVDVALSATGELLLASGAALHPMAVGFPHAPRVKLDQLLLREAPVGFKDPVQSAPEVIAGMPQGTLVAVGFANGSAVMQFREPSLLVVGPTGIALPGESVTDTGNQLFHLETGSGLACASCHPEGQEDGHVWNFRDFGPRRTQSLRGGLLGTEPFHWDGAEANFNVLTSDVMSGRMGGPPLTLGQAEVFARYVDRFPAMPAPSSVATPAALRGKQLFEDAQVGCAACHSGARFSNDLTVNIGSSDGLLQVPSLIGVWARAPYLHDGCATTLLARFTSPCDTGKHGDLTKLAPEDLSAIAEYLETL